MAVSLTQFERRRIWESLIQEAAHGLSPLKLSIEVSGRYCRGHRADFFVKRDGVLGGVLLPWKKTEGMDVQIGRFHGFKTAIADEFSLERLFENDFLSEKESGETWYSVFEALRGEVENWWEDFYDQCLLGIDIPEYHEYPGATEACLSYRNSPAPKIQWLSSSEQTNWPVPLHPNFKWALYGGVRSRWWFDEEDKEIAEEIGLRDGIVSRVFRTEDGREFPVDSPEVRVGEATCYPRDAFGFLSIEERDLEGALVLSDGIEDRVLTRDSEEAWAFLQGIWAENGGD